MDNHLMESFYKTIKEKEYSRSSLKSYLEMLENLPNYKANYLKEELEKMNIYPFESVWIYSEKNNRNNAVVLGDFEYTHTDSKKYHFAIDIWTNLFGKNITENTPLNSLSIFARDKEPEEWKPIIEKCIENYASEELKPLINFNETYNRFMCEYESKTTKESHLAASDKYIVEVVPKILEMFKKFADASQKE